MKIKISRKKLMDFIIKAKVVTSGKHTLAILSSMLLVTKDNTVEMFATDLEIMLYNFCSAEVILPGSIVVPINVLFNFIQKTKSQEILIEAKESCWVNISDGNAAFNFACANVDDFPTIPEIIYNKVFNFSINLFDFKEMLAVVGTIRDIDVKLYYLGAYFQLVDAMGSRFNEGELSKQLSRRPKTFFGVVTTGDGRLLSSKKLINFNSVSKDEVIGEEMINGFLISKIALNKLNSVWKNSAQKKSLKKLFEDQSENILFDIVGKDYFILKKGGETILIRRMEGEFPDYRTIIKGSEENKNYAVVINREEFLEIMNRMSAIQNDAYRGMIIDINNSDMKITFTNPDVGEILENMKIKYSGDDPIKISFNINYFIDFLSLMKSEWIKLRLRDDVSSCIITGEQDKDLIGIIMPMKM